MSFRREKYVPRGGPDGGDGGDGGSVIIEATNRQQSLEEWRRRKTVRAADGEPGGGGKRYGARGSDLVVEVPVGTLVWKGEELLADLAAPGMRAVLARGGEGGRGNARFATSTRRAPRIAERGLAGEEARLRLELRLLAEAGLVGLPNTGKSSLLRAVSEARPKVGAYPFTTVEPHLGVVEREHDRLVLADIPGLIEGAHGGAGLGTQFLRHIERTAVLVHVLDAARPEPLEDLAVVRGELEAFGHGLAEKRWLVALNKLDLPGAAERADAARRELRDRRVEAVAVSALTGEGVDKLIERLFALVDEERTAAAARAAPAELPVLRPAGRRRPRAARVDGGWRVESAEAEKTVAKLGLASEEARAEVARRLVRQGVADALRRAGVQPGDRVWIGDAELEWPL